MRGHARLGGADGERVATVDVAISPAEEVPIGARLISMEAMATGGRCARVSVAGPAVRGKLETDSLTGNSATKQHGSARYRLARDPTIRAMPTEEVYSRIGKQFRSRQSFPLEPRLARLKTAIRMRFAFQTATY